MNKNVFLVLAVIGAIIPWIFFANFIAVEGFDLPLFVRSMFVNGSAGGFSADVLISSVVFWVWSYADSRKRGIRRWWVIVPANLLVGLSLALPLYLYMRADAD